VKEKRVYGTMDERRKIANRMVRYGEIEGWKALLFIVAPEEFAAMVDERRERQDTVDVIHE
jgi:hypothetical protein